PRSGRLQPLSDPRRARALALRGDLARIEGRAPRADRALPPRAGAVSQGSQLRRSPDAVQRVSAAPLIRGPALSPSSGSRIAPHPKSDVCFRLAASSNVPKLGNTRVPLCCARE